MARTSLQSVKALILDHAPGLSQLEHSLDMTLSARPDAASNRLQNVSRVSDGDGDRIIGRS